MDNISKLPGIVAKISSVLRNQYLLGFSSSNPDNDGMYRKVEVRLSPDASTLRLHAVWRRGYYAPCSKP